jgi:hypothetical protein
MERALVSCATHLHVRWTSIPPSSSLIGAPLEPSMSEKPDGMSTARAFNCLSQTSTRSVWNIYLYERVGRTGRWARRGQGVGGGEEVEEGAWQELMWLPLPLPLPLLLIRPASCTQGPTQPSIDTPRIPSLNCDRHCSLHCPDSRVFGIEAEMVIASECNLL